MNFLRSCPASVRYVGCPSCLMCNQMLSCFLFYFVLFTLFEAVCFYTRKIEVISTSLLEFVFWVQFFIWLNEFDFTFEFKHFWYIWFEFFACWSWILYRMMSLRCLDRGCSSAPGAARTCQVTFIGAAAVESHKQQ